MAAAAATMATTITSLQLSTAVATAAAAAHTTTTTITTTRMAAFIVPASSRRALPRPTFRGTAAVTLHHAAVTDWAAAEWNATHVAATALSSHCEARSPPVPPGKSLRHKLGLVDGSCRSSSRSSVAGVVSSHPSVVGHRGALYECLENTREAFLHCVQMGCQAVELDAFVLCDNTIVVFHGGGTDEHPGDLTGYCQWVHGDDDDDDTSNMVTLRRNNILDLTYEQTQQLQFNPEFEEFPCPPEVIKAAKIPTLEQVLKDLQPYPIEIKIELKGPGVVVPVLELVERLDMTERCSYSSFVLDRLQELRVLRPDRARYRTGALFVVPPSDYLALASNVGATEIHLQYDECSVERIQEIHQAGFASMAWLRGPIGMMHDTKHTYWDIGTTEDVHCYQALLETGVQQICCNKPNVLLDMLWEQPEDETASVISEG